jgi:DNA-binding winged helix-turn-helix (wHTH) protein/tetratricopeptide (TPR) repeat protein
MPLSLEWARHEARVTANSSRRARFSSYQFDPATGDLTRLGTRVRLESQPARVLAILIDAGGELVSREELIGTLWPGEIEGQFDRRLDKAIAKLRASLNDNPTAPQYVETLKGRGYRFLAKVTFETPGLAKASESLPEQPALEDPEFFEQEMTSASGQGTAHRILTWRYGAALAGLIIAASAGAWWFHRQEGARGSKQPVVLVLGFHDVSASEASTWVSQSIDEWLLSDLKAGGDLQAFQGWDSPALQMREAGTVCKALPRGVAAVASQAFNADLAVFGAYSAMDNAASGDRWRLDVCVQDLHSSKSPESLTVIGAKGDIPQLVFDSGELFRSKQGLKQLSSRSLGYLRATLPASPAAAQFYAEGTLALSHFEPEKASVLLTEAVQLEPQHAPSHAALSSAWAALGYQERSQREAVLANQLAKDLSPLQQLEYQALAEEARNDWPAAVDTYTRTLHVYPESVDYGVKLAEAQIKASKAQLALATLRALKDRNKAAANDPRVELTEAAADSAASDFVAQRVAATRAESLAREQNAGLLVADAEMAQGNADQMLDRWDEAQRMWGLAGKTYESTGDRRGMADALNQEALLAWQEDDATTATRLFNQAMGLSQSIGDRGGIAYSLSHLGTIGLYGGKGHVQNSAAALQMLRSSAQIYRELGNLAEEGNLLSLFGDESMVQCRYEEAKAYYVRAIALSQAANDKSRIANRMLDLGIVAAAQGKNQDAERSLRQSMQAYEELGQTDRVAIARNNLAGVLLREGKVDQAVPMLDDSLATLRSLGRRMQVFEVRLEMIHLEMVRNPVKAEALAQENLELSKSVGRVASSGDPSAYAELAEAEARQGKLTEANRSIQQAFAPTDASMSDGFMAEMLLARGYVGMYCRNFSDARLSIRRARNLTNSHGQIYLELESRLALAELDFRQFGKAAEPELNSLRQEAKRMGYGFIPLKIDAFLQTAPLS